MAVPLSRAVSLEKSGKSGKSGGTGRRDGSSRTDGSCGEENRAKRCKKIGRKSGSAVPATVNHCEMKMFFAEKHGEKQFDKLCKNKKRFYKYLQNLKKCLDLSVKMVYFYVTIHKKTLPLQGA